jgi:hypothetical protein
MIKAKGHDVKIKGTLGDLMKEISFVFDEFIDSVPKDTEDDRKASSRAIKSLLFIISKKTEEAGLSTKMTREEKKEFEDAWKKSKEESEKLMTGLKRFKELFGIDDDEDDSDDDDGMIGMCAIPMDSKKGKAIMDILGIKPKDSEDDDDDDTEDDIPDFLW